MLYDGLTFVGRPDLPASPVEGQLVYLTQAYGDFEKGLYYWNGEEWTAGAGGGSGIDAKDSVRVATTGTNIPLSGLQVIDGIQLEAEDRVLVKDQSDLTKNGIYEVVDGEWKRAGDANKDKEVTAGLYTYVEEGDDLAGSSWILRSTGEDIVLGTSELNFAKFSGEGTINAGAGLVKSGDAIALETMAGLSPGTYNKVVVDKHGRVSGGENPNTLAGHGITDAQQKITGAASTVTENNMLADRLVVSNAQGKLAESAVSTQRLAEIDSEVTNFQGSLSGKQDTITGAASSIAASNLTSDKVLVSDEIGKVKASEASSSDLANIAGTTGNVQQQIDKKLDKSGGDLTGQVNQPLAPDNPNALTNRNYVDQQVSSVSPMPRSIFSSIAGEVVAFDGGVRWYPPFPITVTNVRAFIDTPSQVNPVVADVLLNAVSIFAEGEKPSIAINEHDSGDNVVDVTLQTTDYLTISVLSGGGKDMSIRIDYVAAT